jgi:hypothetical protein
MDVRQEIAARQRVFHEVIKDVDAFARHVSETFGIPIENMIVLAHSLAASPSQPGSTITRRRSARLILATAHFT